MSQQSNMAILYKSISAFVGFVLILSTASGAIVCEDGFCSNYLEEEGCFRTAEHCHINNATHRGLWVPSPTICNCCDYCLPFYNEGEPCSLGGPGTGLMIGRCGAGLTCVAEDDGNHCRRMESKCHSEQDDYDDRHKKGEVGSLEERPRCDEKGNYAPAVCVPTQTCFCQSNEGERIFGEILYRDQTTINNMHCGCSRMNHQIRKQISPGVRFPVVGPRCTSDGNFHPVQCIANICYCVDRITGRLKLDGRINLNERPFSDISCYDPELDMFKEINYAEEPPFPYTTPCQEMMKIKIEQISESIELGFDVDFFSTVSDCLPDGTFGRIETTANGSKICADAGGDQIDEYQAKPNSPGYHTMDCKCAMTSHLMEDMTEKPVCCSNGNFRPIQCRRGVCRRVDSDGRQIGADLPDVNMLPPDWRTC